jgi:hypothetical protein
MLGGKGNKDKAVAGLDGFSLSGIEYMSTYTPLPQLLGPEIYRSENVEGFEGLGQLGEPLTLASVGAAMGVLAGIIAALKQIGDIFPKKTKGSEDFDENINEAAENNVPVPGTTPVPLPEASTSLPAPIAKQPVEESFVQSQSSGSSNVAIATQEREAYSVATNPYVPVVSNNSVAISEEDENMPVPNETYTNSNSLAPPAPTKETFWDKNKTWLKPVAIGVGGISLIAIGFAVLKPKTSNRSSPGQSLSGVPKRKKKRNNKRKNSKSNPSKKTAVALL